MSKYREPDLLEWWVAGHGVNAITVLRTKTGEMEVYVRRHIADQSVMMIASVSTRKGFGGARLLYGSLTRDIPAIAEQIINPDLDAYLAKNGWDWAYYDLGGIPTRINQAFQRRFPLFREAKSSFHAIMMSREDS